MNRGDSPRRADSTAFGDVSSAVDRPPGAQSALRLLEQGNRAFSRRVEAFFRNGDGAQAEETAAGLRAWTSTFGAPGDVPRQRPFAIVVGCSDARAPMQAIFQRPANDLFEIRVAGTVMPNEALGSVEYALEHLASSVRAIVVLGHTHCGGVTAAVDTYLQTAAGKPPHLSVALRSIVDRIQPAVDKAVDALGFDRARLKSLDDTQRQLLIDASIHLNAALVGRQLPRFCFAMRLAARANLLRCLRFGHLSGRSGRPARRGRHLSWRVGGRASQ